MPRTHRQLQIPKARIHVSQIGSFVFCHPPEAVLARFFGLLTICQPMKMVPKSNAGSNISTTMADWLPSPTPKVSLSCTFLLQQSTNLLPLIWTGQIPQGIVGQSIFWISLSELICFAYRFAH